VNVFLRVSVKLDLAAFGAKVDGLAFVFAGGGGFPRVDRHFANWINSLHESSCLNIQKRV
jgi:hypothetical protein